MINFIINWNKMNFNKEKLKIFYDFYKLRMICLVIFNCYLLNIIFYYIFINGIFLFLIVRRIYLLC